MFISFVAPLTSKEQRMAGAGSVGQQLLHAATLYGALQGRHAPMVLQCGQQEVRALLVSDRLPCVPIHWAASLYTRMLACKTGQPVQVLVCGGGQQALHCLYGRSATLNPCLANYLAVQVWRLPGQRKQL
jgi:hypothetical protein